MYAERDSRIMTFCVMLGSQVISETKNAIFKYFTPHPVSTIH